MMLSEQILAKMKGSSSSKDTALSPELEHNKILNLKSPRENKFLSYQFKLPRVSTQSMPRKNKYLLQYKMGRSCIYDTPNINSWPYLPSTSLGYEFHVYKPFRTSSRSAKIMRALSSNHSSFRDRNVEIRKSLNFDSTPSPKEHSSYDESSTSSISADTPPSILNSSLTDSSDNSVPIASVESIDENQNQTPQQNRKYIKILNNRTKENTRIQSRASYVMSLLEKAQKGNANLGIYSHHVYSNVPSRIITASTPRNLSQEFNQEVHDRPHTPENMINVIPESISAIKKSHKKEKLYFHEEQSFTQRTDSIKNDNLHLKTTTELLEIDIIAKASCSAASANISEKKNRNIKRTLIYNVDDELNSDISSDFDHSILQKTTSTENDSLESGLDRIESDEMQDIDSNDCESHEENMQVSIDLIDNNHGGEEEDCSKLNIYNEEVNQLSLQKESSSTCNVNVMNKNRMASPESNSVISRDTNKVGTPENHINMVEHILTESIKKSHKKIKHGNRRALFETNDRHEKMESAKSEISAEGTCNNDQDIKSQVADTICVTNPQNSDRPNTPENINSSRLLLLDFNSVKKSHKKDKRSKRTSSFAQCHDYEYRKRSNSLRSRYEEENINRTLHRNESLGLEESPGKSPKKKKKPVSMFLQSSTPKMSSAFMFLGRKDIDDEFKIYTPIKKRQILYTVTHHVSADEMTQEKDEPAQATSKEIDCSRCVTPVARCIKGSRKNQDLTSERDNAKRFETDISILKTVDTANLKDNGRSTPINMSTMELLCNVDSIKKSHKKDKHSRRPISEKKQSYIAESNHTTLSLKHVDNHCTKKEMCSNTREKEKDKSYREITYNDPQPSTSRGGDNIKNAKNTSKSRLLNTTPPNSLNAMNLMKLFHTTSIKKSHKKERDFNAQAKYILMSQEHELSDDGSIFDEEDRLISFIEHDNSNEITTI